jgi:adenylate cyclase class IV
MPVPPLVQILNPRVVLAISKSRELFLIEGVVVIMDQNQKLGSK